MNKLKDLIFEFIQEEVEIFIYESYNKPRKGMKRRWSTKYKRKISCSKPKGFSQKQYCKRKHSGGKYKT